MNTKTSKGTFMYNLMCIRLNKLKLLVNINAFLQAARK